MRVPSSPARHHRIRQIAILIGGGVALAVVMTLVNRHGAPAGPKSDATIPVSVAKAAIRDLPLWKSGVGSIQPIEMVDVKPRVDGQIVRILFHEGDIVAKGQALVELDPRPYKAAHDQAGANRDRDAAQLANTRLDLNRAVKLAALGAASAQSVDTLKAQLATQTAEVAADQAQIDTARLNLEWTTIRSPIAGRVGLRQVNLGAAVHQSDATGVVTVTQIAPIAVIFTLPQDALAAITGANRNAEVIISDQAGARDLAHGRLETIDSQVDPTNGQIKVKASFDNDNGALWPGTLISARLLAGTEKAVVTVPAGAIQNSQNGPFVYLMKPDDTVVARPVQIGAIVGDIVALRSGVAAGNVVVTSGQVRIAIGSKVAPRADAQ
jgi:membrane fusion protein, multidrug efflux system